jgi:UDP-N-acetylmuramoyl-tripeptide--D-alanyl-D-alanine ligase
MMTAKELATALRPSLVRAPAVGPLTFRRPVVDSRKAGRGDLFFALRGERVDGHDFVADAAERGATGAVLARPVEADIAQYVVADPLTALQDLARQRRQARRNVRVIGVTGSVGKTTTKEIIAAVLATRYPLLKSEGNLNSEIGLPMVLLSLTQRHRRAVLEMGMWAPGEIGLLCDIARPDIGVVTMVGPVHLERMHSMQAIEDEKAALPAALPADGVAVLNADDQRVARMAERTRAHVITYGFAATADVRAEDIESHGLAGVRFTLVHGNEREPVYTRLPGRALVSNALAAAAAALVDGLTIADVASALSTTQPPARFAVHSGRGGTTIIDDSYNASPSSMLAALELLREASGRRVAVLGDMLELGDASHDGHADVGRFAAAAADVIVAVGALGGEIGEAARAAGHRDVHLAPTRDDAIELTSALLRPGDSVLIKGSRGLALEELARALREDA